VLKPVVGLVICNYNANGSVQRSLSTCHNNSTQFSSQSSEMLIDQRFGEALFEQVACALRNMSQQSYENTTGVTMYSVAQEVLCVVSVSVSLFLFKYL
jgi:hypothetical protein